MKKVFNIFLIDIQNIRRRPAAIIMIIGLCFLPSLYAWINIKACWDPYANTGNIPIAVVNEDEGVIFNGKRINVGNEIASELKKNKSIKWIFIDEWQGNYGLNEGKYYALLDIPSDFSSKLVSLTTTTPEKPNIIYRSNEKLNAIASKITDAAKNKIVSEIKTNFVNELTKEALLAIKSNIDVNKSKSNLIELKDTLNEATKNLSDTQKYIGEASNSSKNIAGYLLGLQNNLPKVTDKINNLEIASESSRILVSSAKDTINSAASNINSDMSLLQSNASEFKNLLSQLNTSGSPDTMDKLISKNNYMSGIISSDIKYLEAINKTSSNNYLTSLINNLYTINSKISTNAASLNNLKSSVSQDKINDINSLNNEISLNILNASNTFYNSVLPLLNNTADSLNTNLSDIDSFLASTKAIAPQLNALTNYISANNKLSEAQAADINKKLSNLLNELNTLNSKVNSISSENLNDILKLLSMNNNELASFISSPLTTKEVDLYNVGTLGVGLTPFYSVLAIWVGVLLCSSTLTTEFKNLKSHEHLNMWQKHFGKMLLFLLLSFIQATIIILGDMFLLKVNPVSVPTVFVFAYASSITFTFIIFTLVSIFGNVGKAIAVVMMVFQIAGSSGIYPIQTNPKIFGILEPLWPFTYAINGFREAIAGPVWENVYKNLLALLCFVIFFLLFTISKKTFHNLTKIMEHKFKESGL